jgi:hypothetical protein
MLPSSTEDLDMRGDLSSIADRTGSQYTVSTNIDPFSDAGAGMCKEASEGDAAVQRATRQRKPVKSDSEIVANNTRHDGTKMGRETKSPGKTTEPCDDGKWQRRNYEHILQTEL